MIGQAIDGKKVKQLEKTANLIRQDIIKALLNAGSGHSAGPLGMAEVFTALYFHVLNVKPKQPKWLDRDRFVLSCGHINPVFYATLARAGFFTTNEFIKTLRMFGTRLHGHPHNLVTPGVENSSGPLPHALSWNGMGNYQNRPAVNAIGLVAGLHDLPDVVAIHFDDVPVERLVFGAQRL